MEEHGAAVLLTSSRSSSPKLREFLNELALSLPGVEKITRGKLSHDALLEEAAARGARYVVVVYARRGNPSSIRAIDVARRRWVPYALLISGVKMREDLPALVLRRPKAETAAVVDHTASEIPDLLMSIFKYPVYYSVDLGKLRGRYDTLITVRGEPGAYSLELVDGGDLGPRGPIIRLRGVAIIRPTHIGHV